MPISVPMEFPYDSDQPGPAGGGGSPGTDPVPTTDPGTRSGQEGITPERLTQVIRRLETGFYDSPEVREHVAHRVREELGP